MAVLNINLGLKSYEICDTDGNTVGVIRFNPSDPGMVSRWKEVQEFINGLESMNLTWSILGLLAAAEAGWGI